MLESIRRKILLPHFACVGILALFTGNTYAQTFTLLNNQLQISAGSGTNFSAQTPTISALGVVSTIIDVPSTNGVGMPSFSFTLVPNNIPNGSYSFRIGVSIDDDANMRRIEAVIETLTLTVNGAAVAGTIPVASNPNGLQILARNGSNTLHVSLNVANKTQDGPISVSGGTVSFNASTLIERIRNASHAIFDTYILKEFDQAASYTYRISVQQTSNLSNILNFGTTHPSFTALPKVGVEVNAKDAFILDANEFANRFTSAPTVTGKFNVVIAGNSSGGNGGSGGNSGSGGDATSNVEDNSTALNNQINNIIIPSNGIASSELVNALNNAVTNTNNLLANSSTQILAGTLSATQALINLSTANSALEKAGTARQLSGGGSVSTSESTATISNIAKVVGALSHSPTALSPAQKDQLATLVTSAVSSANKLITEGTPRAALLNLVEATSKLLQSSKNATGEVKEDLVTQLNAMSTAATRTILPTLPASIRGTTDLNSIDAIRTLATTKATVLEIVQKTSVEACANDELADAERQHEQAQDKVRVAGLNFGVGSAQWNIAEAEHRNVDDVYAPLRNAYQRCLANLQNNNESNELSNGQSFIFAATRQTPVFNTNGLGLLVNYAGGIYPVNSNSARLVPDILSDGISVLPDGRLLYVNAGSAIELYGAALNPETFASALTSAAYAQLSSSNGSVLLDIGNNERFAGAFAIDDISTTSAACDSLSFKAPTGDPTNTSYVFEMLCSGGAKQRISPFIENPEFFSTIANAGFDLRMDRNTGIVSIDTIGNFRPSFFVTPLNTNDIEYYNANKNADGIAFRENDANGDGNADYEVISANGKQLLYGLQTK